MEEERLIRFAQRETLLKSHDNADLEQEIEYPFFTEATRPKALREARVHIAHYPNLKLDCREIGDDRPLSGCSFSPDLATWSNLNLRRDIPGNWQL